jgi:O-antigen/teichoic acid export membrane protein
VTLALTISATWLLLPPLGLEGAGIGWAAGKLAGLCVALVLLARGRAMRPASAGGA